jgi:hypothetical protein
MCTACAHIYSCSSLNLRCIVHYNNIVQNKWGASLCLLPLLRISTEETKGVPQVEYVEDSGGGYKEFRSH